MPDIIKTKAPDSFVGGWGTLTGAKPCLEHVTFVCIHKTCSNLLIAHVRDAQNRFPPLSNMF